MFEIIFLLCLNFYISSAVDYPFGTTAVLVCENNAQYYGDWQKSPLVGGVYTYLQSNTGKYGTLNAKHLTISNLNFDDSGYYRCIYKNWGWFDGRDQLLTVTGTPNVTISRQSHFAQIGTEVTFVCTIQSNPTISELWWTDNKAQVITDTHKYRGGNILNPNLTSISVKDSDNGVYTCYAKNTAGTSAANTTLITGNITQATILKEYYVAIKGQDITLECLIKTEYSNKDLYWLKDSINLMPYKMVKYNGGILTKPSLTIKNIVEDDAGYYTCKLKNKFENSEDVVELKVLSVHVGDPVNLNIRANDTVTLPCVIIGGNGVAWRRNNQIIDTTSSVIYSGGTLNTPSLTIRHVTRYHSGNYTCQTSYDLTTVNSKQAIPLVVKDIPLVYQSSDDIKASAGDTIQLECVYESYPEPSVVFWKRDGEKLNLLVPKYNGSTINEPSLTIYYTELLDTGTYVCGVVNDIGTGYSRKIQLLIEVEKQPKYADKLPVIIGTSMTSVAVFVLILCIFIVMKRRRVFKKRQESSYETTEMINAETHAYGKTDTYHEYCNSAIKQTKARNNDIPLMEGDCLLERYNASELTKRIGDADSLKANMRAEFMFLESNGSKVDVLINDYDEVVNTNETGVSTEESKMLYIKRSADDIFVFSSLPDDGNVEQFWSMIINYNIENIIMIVQKNEKSSSFYPTQDDVFKVAMLEIEMQSSEKMNENICLLRFSLYDKKTKTKKPVKIFKTVKWDDSDKHPPVETICSLLDKVKVEEGQPVLLIGSKGKGFSVCGAVSLCLYSVRAIERETTFSLLEYATLLKRIEDDFIKIFEDYEFCYEVMAQYLEILHTYSFIE